MADNDEIFMNLEREFQKKYEAQKNFYESRIYAILSEYDYFKNQSRLETENKVKWGNEKLKAYYENQLQSQKEWYEAEIERRKKEIEDWHIKNLQEKLDAMKKGYEEMLQAKEDELKAQEKNFRIQEENFNIFI